MPSSPTMWFMGILNMSPMAFTMRLVTVRTMTPEKNSFEVFLVFMFLRVSGFLFFTQTPYPAFGLLFSKWCFFQTTNSRNTECSGIMESFTALPSVQHSLSLSEYTLPAITASFE